MFTYWEKTKKYYPKMAKRGYTFTTNMTKTDMLNPMKVKEIKGFCVGEDVFLGGKTYKRIKNVIVKGLKARRADGSILEEDYPVFSKFA